MKPFTAMNIEFECKTAEFELRPKLYMSVTLEMPNTDSLLDNLCDVIVRMVHFDPYPMSSRMFLVMSLNNARFD